MLIGQDAERLQYDYGIIELDVLESKKGNQLFLFYNLVNHLCSERTDLKKEDGFISKHFKMPQNTKSEPLLSEQSLFTDVKQPSNSKIFVSNTIKDQLKIEYCNDNEIFAGVIKSIVPKYHLRSCPELRSSLKFSLLIQIMRCNFSEKDSSSMLTEMSNLVQSVNESTYDFVATPMSNQEKVMVLAIILAIILILVIKQAVSHSHTSCFEQTLPT